jgi:O-antigen/teichoic acid export membrane protein
MYTKDLYRLEFHYEKCIALLQYGYPFLFVGLVSVLLSSNDKIFLSVLLNLGEVGIYTIGVGLSSALSLITSGFQTALGPFAFKIASDSNSKIVYSRIFLYYSYIISFFWLGLVLFSKEILMVLVPSQYQIAYIVVPFLAGGVIMTGFLNIFCLSAGITKNTHLIAISSLSGLCMNMILMVFLIPHFGILGAAGASFVSICTSSIVMNILGQKIFFIDYPYKKAGLVFLIACIFWNLSLLTNTFSLLSSILLKIVLIFLFGILIFQLLKFDKHFFI